jgi:hypothetical protein
MTLQFSLIHIASAAEMRGGGFTVVLLKIQVVTRSHNPKTRTFGNTSNVNVLVNEE